MNFKPLICRKYLEKKRVEHIFLLNHSNSDNISMLQYMAKRSLQATSDFSLFRNRAEAYYGKMQTGEFR